MSTARLMSVIIFILLVGFLSYGVYTHTKGYTSAELQDLFNHNQIAGKKICDDRGLVFVSVEMQTPDNSQAICILKIPFQIMRLDIK
jgi:hypothetical protein